MIKKILIFVFLFFVSSELILRLSQFYATHTEKTINVFINPFKQKFEGHYKANSEHEINTTEFSFRHIYDKFGFRNESNLSKDAEILAFGDSFTEGMGTHQDSTWVKFLSQKLDKTIYNAGKIGSDPHFYLNEYRRIRNNINVDKVIVLLNFSDIADFRFRHSKEIKCDVNINLYKNLHLYRFYNHFLLGKDYMFLQKKNRKELLKKILEDIITTIIELDKECKEDNRKLLVFIHPLPQQYYKNLDSRLNFNYIENLAFQLNLNCVKTFSLRNDLEKLIETKENWRKISWEIDGHFNAKGYKSLADVIYSKLMTTKDF